MRSYINTQFAVVPWKKQLFECIASGRYCTCPTITIFLNQIKQKKTSYCGAGTGRFELACPPESDTVCPYHGSHMASTTTESELRGSWDVEFDEGAGTFASCVHLQLPRSQIAWRVYFTFQAAHNYNILCNTKLPTVSSNVKRPVWHGIGTSKLATGWTTIN